MWLLFCPSVAWFLQLESGPIALWWEALLIYVPLNLIGMFLLPLSTWQRRFQIGFFAVFIMANYVIFQPWELDNTKARAVAAIALCGMQVMFVTCALLRIRCCVFVRHILWCCLLVLGVSAAAMFASLLPLTRS